MIDKLEMFIALANEGHFGRAALACGVTQPSLSSAIKALEAKLGVQLVYRGARYQGLTPEGQRVLDRARRLVGDARSLREEMRALRHGLSGTLRIGVIPTALPMVASLTAPFTRRHPAVKVSILSRTSAEILSGLDRLDLDAGITYLDNEPLGRVTQQPLYIEYYRLVVRADHPLAGRDRVTWGELGDLPLCLLTADMQNRRIVNQRLSEAGARVQPTVESNSTITLIAHVASGQWVSILPKKLADLGAAGGALRAIPIVEPEAEHLVGLIAAQRDPPTALIAALMEEGRRAAEVKR